MEPLRQWLRERALAKNSGSSRALGYSFLERLALLLIILSMILHASAHTCAPMLTGPVALPVSNFSRGHG